MEIKERIRQLLEVFRVANDDIIGNTARVVFNLKWSPGPSARNQAHKILDELALTKQIQKGNKFYAVNEYRGSYGDHDKSITEAIAQLLTLKLPITAHREVSFSNGRRADLAILIGRGKKAICVLVECVNKEEITYLRDKIESYRNWDNAEKELSELFETPIPHFAVVTKGSNEAMSLETFIDEVSK